MNNQPIAVFGATGAQGGPVVQALLSANRPVRAIARTESKLHPLAEQGAEIFALDLADVEALKKALSGVAGAFVQLPFVPVAEILENQAHAISEVLEAANVPMTVVTLSGTAPTKLVGAVTLDTKTTTKRIMEQSKAPLVIFEPFVYLSNICSPFTAPRIIYNNEFRYPLTADHRMSWISIEDQAKLALGALQRPDLAGQQFYIGQMFTGPELAAGISDGLGRTIRYVPLTPEQFGRDVVAPFLGEQAGEALVDDYTIINNRPSGLNFEVDTQTILRELNMSLTSVADWTRQQPWEAVAQIGAKVLQ
ncbi:MAG: NmrA family NAD(P)-binding protein [Chloroflexota bacterium]